jgi:serine phosphatase RsbU (regulator of sigma subunit)
VAVLIGDVAGHGIQAARAATLTKDVLHAFTHQSLDPASVLEQTNTLLLEKGLTRFVTVFLGILEMETGLLRYCSAGHPEVLIRRAAGKVESLRSGSSPLGIFPEAAWIAHEVPLGEGDLLFLYTDGVIEARMDGEFFGEDRLRDFLRRRRRRVEGLPEQVLDEVLAFSKGILVDDVAMLAVALADDMSSAG